MLDIAASSAFSKRYYAQQNSIIFKRNLQSIFRLGRFHCNNFCLKIQKITEKIIIYGSNFENFYIKFR